MLRKTLRMSLLVGLTVLSTMSIASVTDLQANVRFAGEKSFALYLNGLSTNVQIVLEDQDGRTLYKEQLKNLENFAKRYNLSNLPNGEYILTIEDELIIKSIDLSIEGNLVIFEEEENTFKPQTTTTNSIVKINMPTMNNSELKVAIKDINDYVVFEEVVITREEGLKRAYDLSKIKAGEYKFIFYTNGYKVIKPVRIEN